jgi:N-acyl-D-aspartate/D-glutamate deacylase
METTMNPHPNSLLGRWADRWRTTRARIRTERAIARLSPALRRDIGWPDAVSARTGWRGNIVEGK